MSIPGLGQFASAVSSKLIFLQLPPRRTLLTSRHNRQRQQLPPYQPRHRRQRPSHFSLSGNTVSRSLFHRRSVFVSSRGTQRRTALSSLQTSHTLSRAPSPRSTHGMAASSRSAPRLPDLTMHTFPNSRLRRHRWSRTSTYT